MRLIIPILLLSLFVSCNENEITVKPMNYFKNDVQFSCDSYFKKDSLFKVICFDENRDTTLIEHFKNGLTHGFSKQFHPNGAIKLIGNYEDGAHKGIWKGYYPSGVIKSYYFFVTKNDTFNLLYKKDYNTKGEVYALMYPFDQKMDKSKYTLGDRARLKMKMRYSEYDDPLFVIFLENSMYNKEDTIITYGLNFDYEFETIKKGAFKVEGTLYEYDGEKGTEGGLGGSRDFEVSYIVE